MKRPFMALSAEKVRKERRIPPKEKHAKDNPTRTVLLILPPCLFQVLLPLLILHLLLILFHSSLTSPLFQENFLVLLTIFLLLLLCLHL